MAVVPDYNSILAQQQQASTAAIQPALQSLEAQKSPMQSRYDNIIQQLQGKQTSDITAQNKATSQMFEERGILGGALVPQTIQEKNQPINQFYAGQLGQTEADRQNAFAQLASQIAGLQSGAGQNAISAAQSMYNSQLGQYNAELDRAAQERAASAAASQQSQLAATLASLNKSQAAPQQQLTQAQRENSLRTAITDWKAGKAHQGETFLSFVTAWAPYLPLYQIKKPNT